MMGSAVVLAAGRSRRMGCDKAFLPWIGDQPLSLWMRGHLSRLELRPIFVFGPHNISAGQALLGIDCCVTNPECESGRASSLRTGLQAAGHFPGILAICGVDQPRTPQLLRMLRDTAHSNPGKIIIPMAGRHRGHPVFCGSMLRPSVDEIHEHTLGLRGWLDAQSNTIIKIPDNSPQPDINTPANYEVARRRFF